MKNLLFLHLIILIFNTKIFSQLGENPLIPEARRVDWSNAGLTINRPEGYNSVIDLTKPPYNVLPGGDKILNANGLELAISNARTEQGWKVLFFSLPGTYKFGRTIRLTNQDSNLVIKGLGSDQVKLFFETSSSVDHCFYFSGDNYWRRNPITWKLY